MTIDFVCGGSYYMYPLAISRQLPPQIFCTPATEPDSASPLTPTQKVKMRLAFDLRSLCPVCQGDEHALVAPHFITSWSASTSPIQEPLGLLSTFPVCFCLVAPTSSLSSRSFRTSIGLPRSDGYSSPPGPRAPAGYQKARQYEPLGHIQPKSSQQVRYARF